MRISDWSSDVCSSDLGLRLPISNTKIVPIGEPERGDAVVFKPPQHPEQDWNKRVIGLPGDTIEDKDNQVFVNGQPLAYERVGDYVGVGSGAELTGASRLTEKIPWHEHQVRERDRLPFIAHEEKRPMRDPAGPST